MGAKWEACRLGMHVLMECAVVMEPFLWLFSHGRQLVWLIQWKLHCGGTLTLEKEFIPVQQTVSSMSCRARSYLWLKAEMQPNLQAPEPSHGTFPAPRMPFLSPRGSVPPAGDRSSAASQEEVLPWSYAVELGCLEPAQQTSEHLRYVLDMVSC